MNRTLQQQRLLLFGGMTATLAAALLGLLLWRVGKQFRVQEWSDYLGANERKSLSQAVAGQGIKTDGDPLLTIPGLDVTYGDAITDAAGAHTLFFVNPQPRARGLDVMDLIEAYWSDQGKAVTRQNGVIQTKGADGRRYLVTPDPDRPDKVMIWRTEKGMGLFSPQRAQWPAKTKPLFPPIPQNAQAIERGRPGAPGYMAMIALRAPAADAFQVLDADLLRRGWEPMPTDRDDRGNRKPSQRREFFVRLYRHKSEPLGCQVLVERDDEQLGDCSRALLALF